MWTYDVAGMQVLPSDTIDVSGYLTRIVVADTTHQLGFPVFEVVAEWQYTYIRRSLGDTLMQVADEDTLWASVTDSCVVLYDDLVSSDCDTLLQLPLVAGDVWISSSGGEYSMEVNSLAATAATPAGTYENCALIRETNTELPNDYWDYYYADGTGEVLREVHTVTAEYIGDVAYALTDYTP
jgi:hypothetical protein